MAMRTPETFVQEYNGKAIDDDGAYGVQCIDGFRVGCKYVGIPVIPTPNNWADGYWTCKDASGNVVQSVKEWQETYFEKVPVDQLTDGCWIVWPRGYGSHPSSHIAMYYHGQEFGENQGSNRAFHLMNTDFSDAYGGLMPKVWANATAPEYDFEENINGHLYHMYGQSEGLKPVILSPGLNKVAKIRDLDCNYEVFAKVTGCNFYQAKTNVPGQAFGMTFGDISAPLSGTYQTLPGQDSTMFYDIENDAYGDCTGVEINREHNVFSPVLIYPTGNNVQYARMVGLSHTKDVNYYAFIFRMVSGQFVLGLNAQKLSPDQIVVDMLQRFPGIDKVMFIDGGGSAQMMRYKVNDRQVEYTRDTDTPTAGAFALIGAPINSAPAPDVPEEPDTPIEPDQPVEEPETPAEETPAQQDPDQGPVELPEVPTIIIDDQEDPMEDKKVTIREQIARLIDVKSLITFELIGTLCYMQITGKPVDQQFMVVVTAVITWYFSYQVKKSNNGDQK